jgi:hypothetical protein
MSKVKNLNPKKLLDKGEKIIYFGSYNTADRNVQNNFSTMPFTIDINPDGNNIRTVQWFYLNEKSNPEVNLLYETYTFSSFGQCGKQIGSITFNGFYPDSGINGISKSSLQRFTVLGVSGIYNKVTGVIIDFTNPIRKVYFIEKK